MLWIDKGMYAYMYELHCLTHVFYRSSHEIIIAFFHQLQTTYLKKSDLMNHVSISNIVMFISNELYVKCKPWIKNINTLYVNDTTTRKRENTIGSSAQRKHSKDVPKLACKQKCVPVQWYIMPGLFLLSSGTTDQPAYNCASSFMYTIFTVYCFFTGLIFP